MKNKTGLLPCATLAAALSLFALPQAAQAANVTFTNPVLKAYVVAKYDDADGSGMDGEISEEEALLVTDIDVSGGYDTTAAKSGTKTRITSFADIAKFPNLNMLACDSNQLTSLDVTKNTVLKLLYCYSNQLTSLDVTQNTALQEFYCDRNQLTSLDVTKNTALRVLDCSGNKLQSLVVANNAALKQLICSGNKLQSLDVTQNTALANLVCSQNQLQSLDVTKNTALVYLYCSGNKLTSLAVKQNVALERLDCSGNQLTSLDVTQNTALANLVCSQNQLTSLDVTNNTALTDLVCDYNQLSSLNVTKNVALKQLNCVGNELTSLDVTQNAALELLYCVGNELTSLDVSNMAWPSSSSTDSDSDLAARIFLGRQNVVLGSDDKLVSADSVTVLFSTSQLQIWNSELKTLNGNEYVRAMDVSTTGRLTLSVNDSEMGSVSGSGFYTAGTEVTVKATAKSGYVFSKWSDGSTDSTHTLTMPAKNIALTATFEKKTAALLTQTSAPAVGISVSGHVVSVSGVENGAAVRVLDMQGRSVMTVRSFGGSAVLSIQKSGAYVLRVGNTVRNVMVK